MQNNFQKRRKRSKKSQTLNSVKKNKQISDFILTNIEQQNEIKQNSSTFYLENKHRRFHRYNSQSQSRSPEKVIVHKPTNVKNILSSFNGCFKKRQKFQKAKKSKRRRKHHYCLTERANNNKKQLILKAAVNQQVKKVKKTKIRQNFLKSANLINIYKNQTSFVISKYQNQFSGPGSQLFGVFSLNQSQQNQNKENISKDNNYQKETDKIVLNNSMGFPKILQKYQRRQKRDITYRKRNTWMFKNQSKSLKTSYNYKQNQQKSKKKGNFSINGQQLLKKSNAMRINQVIETDSQIRNLNEANYLQDSDSLSLDSEEFLKQRVQSMKNDFKKRFLTRKSAKRFQLDKYKSSINILKQQKYQNKLKKQRRIINLKYARQYGNDQNKYNLREYQKSEKRKFIPQQKPKTMDKCLSPTINKLTEMRNEYQNISQTKYIAPIIKELDEIQKQLDITMTNNSSYNDFSQSMNESNNSPFKTYRQRKQAIKKKQKIFKKSKCQKRIKKYTKNRGLLKLGYLI